MISCTSRLVADVATFPGCSGDRRPNLVDLLGDEKRSRDSSHREIPSWCGSSESFCLVIGSSFSSFTGERMTLRLTRREEIEEESEDTAG
jgi:hypothetical protein